MFHLIKSNANFSRKICLRWLKTMKGSHCDFTYTTRSPMDVEKLLSLQMELGEAREGG